MKSDEGKDIFRKLVDRSDVLVENFGPGVMPLECTPGACSSYSTRISGE